MIEKFSEKRDAASWELAALSSIQGMNIKVIQVVGDQAAGIISYAKKNLAHYSSDLFHMQREISKGGSLALSSQVNSAEDILENEKNYLEKLIQLKNGLAHELGHLGFKKQPQHFLQKFFLAG